MIPYYDHNGITIYNGDCRELLPELRRRHRFDLLLTDPPYGDNHDTDYSRFTGGAGVPRSRHARIEGDVEPFDPSPLLTLECQAILFGANRFSDKLPCGSWLVWDKRTSGGAKNVMSDGEAAWWSKGRGLYIYSHSWDGFNRGSERGTAYHPTQKPVALMRWCLQRANLKPGALVLDPYMGSGPIARACLELGYRYIGIELSEGYCETTVLHRLSQSVMQFEEAA